MQILLVLLCLFFTCAVSSDSQREFKIGLRLGLGGNKKFCPKKQGIKDGLQAGKALRKRKLQGGPSRGLKFETPSGFDAWIDAYQKAIAEDNKVVQEMLIAALGSRVTIKTKDDYKKQPKKS